MGKTNGAPVLAGPDLSQLEQHAMLAAMRLHPNAYGVAIIDHIKVRAGYEPSVGALYAALDRLERRGYVIARQGEATPERGGRRKQYFTLTAKGEQALQNALDATSALRRGVRLKGALA